MPLLLYPVTNWIGKRVGSEQVRTAWRVEAIPATDTREISTDVMKCTEECLDEDSKNTLRSADS
jgi:hypothetical protein